MKRTLQIASLLCLLPLAHSAFAHSSSIGYLYDSYGGIVHSGFGDCVRTAEWSPGNAVAECDATPIKREVVFPIAAPANAPTSAPTAVSSLLVRLSADESFDSGKAELKPNAKAKLGKLVKDLQALDYNKIIIVGHADRTGSKNSNQQLSERRANAVHKYLVSEGLSADKMHSFGEGSNQPFTEPSDCAKLNGKKLQACLAPDRRVEVVITGTRAKQ